MNKKTFTLYRSHAIEWADLPYKEALELRIIKAQGAMDYYRKFASLLTSKTSDEYDRYVALYNDSGKARDWNITLLQEIEDATSVN